MHERWRGTGPRPTVKGTFFFARAPICSLCSPDHKQFRIAWQMPELQASLPYSAWGANAGEGQVFPPPYDEGGPSAAAAPVGAPPYCIETRRSLLPRERGSRPLLKGDKFMKHPHVKITNGLCQSERIAGMCIEYKPISSNCV